MRAYLSKLASAQFAFGTDAWGRESQMKAQIWRGNGWYLTTDIGLRCPLGMNAQLSIRQKLGQ